MKHTRLLNIALAALLAAYAALGTFSRYEADDYCQTVSVNELGIIGFAQQQYENWQGRYSWTLITLALYDTLDSRAPAITPALLILGMVGGWFYLLRPLRPQYALTLALALTLGFVSGVPNVWQSLMWMNAALNYTLPLIGALFLAGWLLRHVPSLAASFSQVSANNGRLSNS